MHDGGLEPSAVEPYVTAHSGTVYEYTPVHEFIPLRLPASCVVRTLTRWVTRDLLVILTHRLSDSHPYMYPGPYRLYGSTTTDYGRLRRARRPGSGFALRRPAGAGRRGRGARPELRVASLRSWEVRATALGRRYRDRAIIR